MNTKYTCEYCDSELGFEPKMCCNGYQCGCMGRPVDPMVCSRECFLLQYPWMAYDAEERELINDLQYLSKQELIEYQNINDQNSIKNIPWSKP